MWSLYLAEERAVPSLPSFGRRQLDLGQLDRVRSALSKAKFELLINCAALTNVDYCESNPEEAFRVNAEAPRLLAEMCREKEARLVHFSTDYVFRWQTTGALHGGGQSGLPERLR
jgi:dTDP-4-dehydrorhamnose reductase